MAKRILGLFDTHIPNHINLDPIFEFAKDWKPDVLVLGGDMHDFGSVSHWLSDQSKHLDSGVVKENYQSLKKYLLDPIGQAVGKRCKKVYLEGNHESWTRLACNQDPNLRGYIELEKNIPAEYQIIPENKVFQPNENFVVIHGHYTNMYHAKKTVETYHTTVFYGHCHTFMSHPLVSPVDQTHFYMGQAIGSLCTLNPGYLRNRPNAWINGFVYFYLENDGTFQYIPVIIVKNRFWAEGRRYA